MKLKKEILGTGSSYSKNIEHNGSNRELEKAITLSFKKILGILGISTENN